MQNDLLQSKLTVLEAMTFATELKLGRNKTSSEKRAAVSTYFMFSIMFTL